MWAADERLRVWGTSLGDFGASSVILTAGCPGRSPASRGCMWGVAPSGMVGFAAALAAMAIMRRTEMGKVRSLGFMVRCEAVAKELDKAKCVIIC